MKKSYRIILSILVICFISYSVVSQNKNSTNYSDVIRTKHLNTKKTNAKDSERLNYPVTLDSVQMQSYVLGKVPYPVGLPDTISAFISKTGVSLNELDVKFTIINSEDTGYSVKFDSKIEIINSNTYDTILNIEDPVFSYPKKDIVIIHAVTGDTSCLFCDKNIIDSSNIYQEYCHEVTTNTYNHANSCAPDDGGVGFDGTSGNFLAGFRNNSASAYFINSLNQSFYDASGSGNKPYKIVIYGDNGSGSPGSLLYLSPLMSTPPGADSAVHTLYNFSAPVSIPANSRFFVGYRQTSDSNISASFQDESPIRPRSFYYSLPDTSNTWYDFAIDPNNFRLDIEPIGSSGLLDLTVIPEGFYNLTSLNMNDTVRVYLRNYTSPYSIVDSSKGVIDSITFSAKLGLPLAPTGSYFIDVVHRNSIETWSSTAISFINGITTYYDFTTATSKAYGNNLTLKGSNYCIFSGDADQDGSIDIGDVADIYNDAVNNVSGYVNTDVNGDNLTDISDVLIAYNNSNSFITVMTP